MTRYLAALTILLLLGTVLTRVVLLRRAGTNAMHFGNLDKTDFLIPPLALFYFYTIFAAALGWPLVSAQRFFQSEVVVYRMAESLLAAEVPFSCLNGCVSKQKLNLLKLSACQMA